MISDVASASCFYEGFVRHRSRRAVPSEFRYRLYLTYLDLDIDESRFQGWWWSRKGPILSRFRRADHFGDAARPLSECARDLVESRLGWRPRGPIRLLTSLRQFGVAMNPLSLFYFFDAAGREVLAVVAEVSNTPWNERHCYVLDFRQSRGRWKSARHAKEFHVSPFFDMSMDYEWRIGAPGERLLVRIEHRSEDQHSFEATLVTRRKPMSTWEIWRLPFRYPWMNARILAAIYW